VEPGKLVFGGNTPPIRPGGACTNAWQYNRRSLIERKMKTHTRTEFHEGIELIVVEPSAAIRATPLLFVHGAFTGAWIWQEYYLDYFAQCGWRSCALSLAGHGNSQGRERLDMISLQEYVCNVRSIVACLPTPPVLIGHSMGGMVTQKVLEHEDAPAVVLMASVPPSGLLVASTQMLLSHPTLFMELNRAFNGGIPQVSTLSDALFMHPVSESNLLRYFLCMQPESARAAWDMTYFDLPNLARMCRPPMLILGAECDKLVPASQVEQTAEAYGTTAHIFSDLGHGMMLESTWQESAAYIADWLSQKGF